MRTFERPAPGPSGGGGAAGCGRCRDPQGGTAARPSAYPRDGNSVRRGSTRPPPMILRVNRRRLGADAYLKRLAEVGLAARPLGQQAVLLEKPCRVERLPGFADGEVSVQDLGAQRAAFLLDARDGMRVLDACAAPGGKTGHVLELARCEVLAVDADRSRAARISENLARLQLAARVVVADCRDPEAFVDGRPFDRILLDAPCSASGVVRRHPDIKWRRRRSDAAEFARTQVQLLDAGWRRPAPPAELLL